MKKFIIILASIILGIGCSRESRDEILKVYNWSDYISEDLIGEFEGWYRESTGRNIRVIYQTFDVNEVMLSKIELGHEDYDVTCPSEYIIERMLERDLLLPIDTNFFGVPNYISGISPFVRSEFSDLNGYGKDVNEYAIGYMWGTMGLLWNPKYIEESETVSWDILKDERYAGKILIKDAFRDIYTSFLISLNREKIESGERSISELTRDCSEESIESVRNYILSFRDGVAGWEADFGKDGMVREHAWLNTAWSGDAQWAIEEAKKIGLDLRFSIPYGSIVWFDGWVIPKYAGNPEAARYWINFMSKPENARKNMEVTGYVSAIGGSKMAEYARDFGSDTLDLSYFFGPGYERAIASEIQYPTQSTISQCGLMHDNSDRTEDLLEMWSEVKGNSENGTIVLVIIVSGILLGSIWYIIKKRRTCQRRRRK